MPAEATDNIKDFPAVLSLTLTSPGGEGTVRQSFPWPTYCRARAAGAEPLLCRVAAAPDPAYKAIYLSESYTTPLARQAQRRRAKNRSRYRTSADEKKAGGFPPAFLNHITLRLTPRLRTAAPGCGSFSSRRPDRPDRYRPRSGPESSSSLPG